MPGRSLQMSTFDYSIHYSRFHDDSEDHASVMAQGMSSFLSPALPPDTSAQVLDIGCGYGFALRALRELGYTNLAGVEVSLQQAMRAQKAGFKVDVVTDTNAWLDQRPGQFDVILLLDVLEHVEPKEQLCLLGSIYSSLRPGGVVIITVPNANAILSARWRYIDFTHYSSFTEHSLHFVLRNAGFSEVRIDSEKGLGHFPKRLWKTSARAALRKWIIRWCWLQVFRAEIGWENIEDISFELNLRAVAKRHD